MCAYPLNCTFSLTDYHNIQITFFLPHVLKNYLNPTFLVFMKANQSQKKKKKA